MDAIPVTRGLHHVGLNVSRLEESARFFTEILGWREAGRVPDYPAIFVSDGHVLVTLWQAQGESVRGFDKQAQVGLHHVAFAVADEAALESVHARLREAGVAVEFPPEPVGDGPAKNLFCFEPSGIRVEFFWGGG